MPIPSTDSRSPSSSDKHLGLPTAGRIGPSFLTKLWGWPSVENCVEVYRNISIFSSSHSIEKITSQSPGGHWISLKRLRSSSRVAYRLSCPTYPTPGTLCGYIPHIWWLTPRFCLSSFSTFFHPARQRCLPCGLQGSQRVHSLPRRQT